MSAASSMPVTAAERLLALGPVPRSAVLRALQPADNSQAIAFMGELGALFGLPVRQAQELIGSRPRFDLLSFSECARRRCALLEPPEPGPSLDFLVTDPFDADLVAWARTTFGTIDVVLCATVSFDAWLAHSELSVSALSGMEAADTLAAPGALHSDAEVVSLRGIGAADSQAVRFVNSTLYDALKVGASDIHLECQPTGLQAKFRLDGVLAAMANLERRDLADQVINRIKVMAQLDIAERRIPQDGRLQIAYANRAVDVRVSIMPSIHGEDAVLRILDRQHLAQSLAGLTLAKLGFDDATADVIRHLCRKPHGMLLVTGPTGSGKTTTLYAAISETHLSRDKIITIEDPVEYQLPGVLQIPVNEKKGLTFARGLRSILRHDPDKILVGEIRDAETAQIAVQSALTGHLVFTTVHANTVFDVVGRFEQFGLDSYTFSSAINGVLAQRLLRRICGHCAAPIDSEAIRTLSGDIGVEVQRRGAAVRLLRPVGCEHCRGTGYAGRFALGELLLLSPAVKALIAARAPLAQVQAEAERSGWRSLRSMAIDAALEGHTTAEEVDRVAL